MDRIGELIKRSYDLKFTNEHGLRPVGKARANKLKLIAAIDISLGTPPDDVQPLLKEADRQLRLDEEAGKIINPDRIDVVRRITGTN